MDKLKMHSPDFTQQNVARLAELFPNCVTEARDDDGLVKKTIDFEQLRQELSDVVIDGPRERCHLDWPGKKESLLAGNAPIAKTLRPCRGESVAFESTGNIFIEGDNLDALKLLQEGYLNKVHMIFIDPPYNTGRDFIYDDDFSEDTDTYFHRSNQKDELGNRLVSNTDANGRFHSDWLSMMYPRLRLARNLLREDGVIFISIDDHEVSRLRQICDEIFGEDNFVACIIWQRVFASKNTAQYFSENHDYILVYGRQKELWRRRLMPRTAEHNKDYKNPDNDPRGPWQSVSLSARNYYGAGQWGCITPAGTKIDGPPRGSYWKVSEDKFRELCKDNRIWWGAKQDGAPRRKVFLSEVPDGVVPQTLWFHTESGNTQEAKKELLKYVKFSNSENVLNSVKPVKLIQRMLHLATPPNEGCIVVDFFSGSASTAHAVLQQNALDGGNRKFISVQIQEPLPTPEPNLATIFDIGKMRVGNVIRELRSLRSETQLFDAETSTLGFRVFKVDSSNMKDVYYAPDGVKQGDLLDQIENIKEDRTPEDLLFQVLLDWGVDLSLPIAEETIGGKTVFFVDDNVLAACFDKDINEELVKTLAARKPLRVVFRDSGYGNDSVKINVEQIFKLISPSTEVKSI